MSIAIYVVRHGVAEPKGSRDHDRDRKLTAAGKRELKRVVRGLAARGVRFDAVYTSPWKRARQTAKALGPLCDSAPIETTALIRRPHATILSELHGKTIAVVGHEPWLTQLIALATTGDLGHARSFTLERAGIAHLHGPRKPGRLKLLGLWSPGDFR